MAEWGNPRLQVDLVGSRTIAWVMEYVEAVVAIEVSCEEGEDAV
jgi:hypothetical protein